MKQKYYHIQFEKWEGTYSITPTTVREERYHLYGGHQCVIGKLVKSPLRDGCDFVFSKDRVVLIKDDIPTITIMNSEFVALVVKHFRQKDATLSFSDLQEGTTHTLTRRGKVILHGDKELSFHQAMSLIDRCYDDYHNLLKPKEVKQVHTFYDFIGKRQFTLKELTRQALQYAHELIFLQPVS